MNLIKLFLLKTQKDMLYIKGINKILKEIVINSPLSRKEISESLGISQNMFSKWISTRVGIP